MGQNLDISQSGTYVVSSGMKVELEANAPVVVTLVGDGAPVTKLKLDFDKATQADTIILDVSTFGPGPLQITLKGYNAVDAIQLTGGTLTGVDPTNPGIMGFSYTDAAGIVQTGTMVLKGAVTNWAANPIVICFAAGTMIATPDGEVPVEQLCVGDELCTWDGDIVPIRWIGRRHLSWWDLAVNPQLRPVRIFAGALGGGMPRTDLVVSPQHRVLIEGPKIDLWFGTSRVLVAAKSLVDGGRAQFESQVDQVTYFHLLLDGHQILSANGAPAESLLLGDQARAALGQAQIREVEQIFPELAAGIGCAAISREMALRTGEARVAALQLVA